MDEDEDKNNNESSKDPSNAETFSALESAMECSYVRLRSEVVLAQSANLAGRKKNRVEEDRHFLQRVHCYKMCLLVCSTSESIRYRYSTPLPGKLWIGERMRYLLWRACELLLLCQKKKSDFRPEMDSRLQWKAAHHFLFHAGLMVSKRRRILTKEIFN
ncbi:uncharacterized protein TNCV_885041 [Trichonephila clavipes]|nr:uncharacterized protein TNCV_885041 [Trichonephila clavipes]